MARGAIQFHVDRIVLDTDMSASDAERLTPVLRAAFEDLAARLQQAPASRWRNPTQLALGELRIDALPIAELIGPRGAARLADAFWEQFTSGQNGR
ncbi:MAG TPA: hypothetical protein VIV60_14965 [Polyangiaceae bacterium]